MKHKLLFGSVITVLTFIAMMTAVSPAIHAQDTETPTPTSSETPTETPAGTPTETSTPSATPLPSEITYTGASYQGTLILSVTAGEAMVSALLAMVLVGMLFQIGLTLLKWRRQ